MADRPDRQYNVSIDEIKIKSISAIDHINAYQIHENVYYRKYINSIFNEYIFFNATFTECIFKSCIFIDVDFINSVFTNCYFIDCQFESIKFNRVLAPSTELPQELQDNLTIIR